MYNENDIEKFTKCKETGNTANMSRLAYIHTGSKCHSHTVPSGLEFVNII
jgi:hypothetical protein